MKKYLTRLLIGAGIFILSLLLCIRPFAANGETEDVVELISSREILYGEEPAVEISVIFHDRTYYNDQVYLSYHLEDKKGNVVCFENERYALSMDENAQAAVMINLDFSNISSMTSEKELFLQFDLVDQKNLFWFSQREDISFAGITVPWSIKGAKVEFLELKNEILSNPLIFALNLVIFIFFLGVALYIRAKRDK